MRLWHKDLIKVLPRKQLLSQWRECCCIAANLNSSGKIAHPLIKPILDYSADEFATYTATIVDEMLRRGYNVSQTSADNFKANMKDVESYFSNYRTTSSLYEGWHEPRYFIQCYFNLQEKYDRGMISDDEWDRIYDAAFISGIL